MRRSPSRAAAAALAVAAAALLALAPGARAQAEPKAPPGAFVSLHDVDPTILLDIRYRSYHNFVGRPIRGYDQPLCLLARPAAEALARVQAAVRRRGYTLKVYDCYRPQRAVDDFVAWAKRLRDEKMKAEFYPRVEKRVLFREGYIARRSGHSRGATIDLTLVRRPVRRQERYRRGQRLVDCAAPRGKRFGDNSIDMGTGYDCFDPLAHPFNGRVHGLQRRNRLKLRRAMYREGFKGLATEWWHFTLRDEPYPDTYFDFPVRRSSLG
jgi:D-alanyl-D-alanine dipeptidase